MTQNTETDNICPPETHQPLLLSSPLGNLVLVQVVFLGELHILQKLGVAT